MSKVCISKCLTYDDSEVTAAIERIEQELGAFSERIKPGMTVLVKPNLLGKHKPEEVCTTHPSIVKAVCKMLAGMGARVIVGDSPGGPFTKAWLAGILKTTGVEEAVKQSGAELNSDFTSKVIKSGGKNPELEIINAALSADVIVNLAKFKTHMFTGYTAATKNLFGLIPGTVKMHMHGSHPELTNFCDMLVDIERFVAHKTVLHIVDFVYGMEGPGPSDGTPKFGGRLIASIDPYAADAVCLSMIKTDPHKMPVIVSAKERGIFPDTIEVVGESVEDSIIEDFDCPKVYGRQQLRLPRFLIRLSNKYFNRRPVLKAKKLCKACNRCGEACPPKAIEMKGVAVFDYDKCIRCFCCQELCPFHAIKVKTPLMYKLFRK